VTYPAEAEPDGERFGPHHHLYPLYALLLYVYVTQRYAPILVTGIIIGLVGWFHFWKWYPKTGATLSGVGLILTVLGIPQLAASWIEGSVLLLAVLYATDDWLSHAVGVWTPLDWVFKEYVASMLT